MDEETVPSLARKKASGRVCVVFSLSTELLEIHSEEPSLHVLLIPGNPGVVSFYKDFIEELYELLQGNASITAIGHLSHAGKDREHGKLFSLQEQINHKVDFIKEELKNSKVPLILIGHSLGSYISLEIFKRLSDQVKFAIGLYPFLTLNKDSLMQAMIGMIARSSILSVTISSIVWGLGIFPTWISRAFVRKFLGESWSATAVDAVTSDLMQYHTIRNVLFLAMTEFIQLSEEPDWAFMRSKQNQISFLFGSDDHWGPLSLFEEISKQVPGIALSIEREGHTHSFSCTLAGSKWVADYAANLINPQITKSNRCD